MEIFMVTEVFVPLLTYDRTSTD
jgi:hypothetical protein